MITSAQALDYYDRWLTQDKVKTNSYKYHRVRNAKFSWSSEESWSITFIAAKRPKDFAFAEFKYCWVDNWRVESFISSEDLLSLKDTERVVLIDMMESICPQVTYPGKKNPERIPAIKDM